MNDYFSNINYRLDYIAKGYQVEELFSFLADEISFGTCKSPNPKGDVCALYQPLLNTIEDLAFGLRHPNPANPYPRNSGAYIFILGCLNDMLRIVVKAYVKGMTPDQIRHESQHQTRKFISFFKDVPLEFPGQISEGIDWLSFKILKPASGTNTQKKS